MSGSAPRLRAKAIALPATRSEDRWWILIHAILALLTPLFILAFTGCIPQEEPEAVDFGPAVSADEIMDALNSPTQNMSPTDIKENEFKAFSVSQTIGLGEKTLTKIVGETISKIEESSASRVVASVFVQEYTWDADGKPQESSREGVPYCYDVVPGGCENPTGATAAESKTLSIADKVSELSARVKANSDTKVTYHHFKKWDEIVPAPEKVASQPNCEDIPNCMIHKYWLSFDEVHWLPEGPKAVSYRVATSPDVPYTSKTLTFCVAMLVKISESGQQIYYEQCSDVYNFTKGQVSP